MWSLHFKLMHLEENRKDCLSSAHSSGSWSVTSLLPHKNKASGKWAEAKSFKRKETVVGVFKANTDYIYEEIYFVFALGSLCFYTDVQSFSLDGCKH